MSMLNVRKTFTEEILRKSLFAEKYLDELSDKQLRDILIFVKWGD